VVCVVVVVPLNYLSIDNDINKAAAQCEMVTGNSWFVDTRGFQKRCRPVQADIINFIDIVSLVITICHYNITQFIISPHLSTMYSRCSLLLQME